MRPKGKWQGSCFFFVFFKENKGLVGGSSFGNLGDSDMF